MIKFLFINKHNHFDLICITAVVYFITTLNWWAALLIIVMGALVSSAVQGYLKEKEITEELKKNLKKDAGWQIYARADMMLDAIKIHRAMYGTSFKESLDVVNEYIKNYRRNNGDF